MTTEQVLLSGISAVTTALCVFARILWLRSDQCEKDRKEMGTQIAVLKEAIGLANGTLNGFKRCPADACPFRNDHSRPSEGE